MLLNLSFISREHDYHRSFGPVVWLTEQNEDVIYKEVVIYTFTFTLCKMKTK